MGLAETYLAHRKAQRAADEKIRIAHESAQAKAAAMSTLYAERDAARLTELQHREAVAAERRRGNAPVTHFVTHRAANRPIVVSDFRAELPMTTAALAGVPTGDGPLLYLPPGGGVIKAPRVLVGADPTLRDSPEFAAWVTTVTPLIAEAANRYRGLISLRDPEWLQRFTVATGLGISSTADVAWEGTHTSGLRKETTIEMPVLAGARIGRDGLRLRFHHRPGDMAARWQAAKAAVSLELTTSGFTVGDLAVVQHPSGDIVLALGDRDPASAVSAPDSVVPYDAAGGRSLLGVRVSDGSEAWLRWSNVAGCVIGGIPGSGKTGSLLPVLAGMAGRAELHLFDGKSAYDLKPLERVAATFDRSGELKAIEPTLDRLCELIKLRADVLDSKLGAHNFWEVDQVDRSRLQLAPIFLIIDEAQAWLNPSGKSAADKKLVEKITSQIRTLIQQGRFVGAAVALTTQKPDATNIPTILRDLCENRIAFRTKTHQQSTCILGPTPDDAPLPHQLPPGTPGRCVAVTAEGAEELVQAAYVAPAAIRAYLADKKPVPNQYRVAVDLLSR